MGTLAKKQDNFKNFCHAYFIQYNPMNGKDEFVGMGDDILKWYLTDGINPFDLSNEEMDTFEKSSKIVREMYSKDIAVTLEVVSCGMGCEITVTTEDGFSFVLPYYGEELEVDGKPYFIY